MVITPDVIANAAGIAGVRDTRPLLVLADSTARELDLKPGQTVVGLLAADERGMHLILEGHAFDLPTQAWPWQAGQALKLRVARGSGGLELHSQEASALEHPDAPPMAAAPEAGKLRAMLLMLRPRLGEALDRMLGQGMLAPWLGTSLIDERVRAGGPHPAWRSADPRALRKAILGQVVSTESALASDEVPSPADLRAGLRATLSLKPMDEASEKPLREGIADLDASQLQAAQAHLRGELMLCVHLPFADGHPLRLSIHRPPPSKEQPRPRVTIDMHTTHPSLGDLWIRAGLDDPSMVDLTVWTTRPQVAKVARDQSAVLVGELQRFGLRTGKLEIFDGPRPATSQPIAEPPPGSLINVQA